MLRVMAYKQTCGPLDVGTKISYPHSQSPSLSRVYTKTTSHFISIQIKTKLDILFCILTIKQDFRIRYQTKEVIPFADEALMFQI